MTSGAAAQPVVPKRQSRLVEIDALRGVAAMAVVLFHLTTRYMELFSFKGPQVFRSRTGTTASICFSSSAAL